MEAWKNNGTRYMAIGATMVTGGMLAWASTWAIGDGRVGLLLFLLAGIMGSMVEEATRPWRSSAHGFGIGDAVLAIGPDGCWTPAWVQAFGEGDTDVVLAMGEHGEYGTWVVAAGDLHRLVQA